MKELIFTNADVEFTKNWWAKLLKDEARLNQWLRKLEKTELQGYWDNLDAIEKYCVKDSPQHDSAIKLLTQTAKDELKHSNILVDVLEGRNIERIMSDEEESQSYFWNEMEKSIHDLTSMSAVFYLGEALAAFRFELILQDANTPADIKWFIDQALPDEAYHARGFNRHTTEEALAGVLGKYYETVEKLKGQ